MTLPMIFPLTCHNYRQGIVRLLPIPIKLASLKHALYWMWLVGYLDWLYLLPHIDIIPLDKGELLTFLYTSYWPFWQINSLFNNFHFRRGYDNKFQRLLSHQKEQISYAWFWQTHLWKLWLKKLPLTTPAGYGAFWDVVPQRLGG